MTNKKDDDGIERTVVRVPDKVAKEINTRAIHTLRANTNHANTLHESGLEFAMSNHADVAINSWLLYQMQKAGFTPREAISCFMEFLCGSVLPSFINIPMIRKQVEKEVLKGAGRDEPPVISQVNDMLKQQGLEPLIVAGSLTEIVEQLQALIEAEGKTRQ